MSLTRRVGAILRCRKPRAETARTARLTTVRIQAERSAVTRRAWGPIHHPISNRRSSLLRANLIRARSIHLPPRINCCPRPVRSQSPDEQGGSHRQGVASPSCERNAGGEPRRGRAFTPARPAAEIDRGVPAHLHPAFSRPQEIAPAAGRPVGRRASHRGGDPARRVS